MRQTVIAGNWKMNMTLPEGSSFMHDFTAKIQDQNLEGKSVIVLPPFPLVPTLAEASKNTPVQIGGQNCHEEVNGAYTGEVSAPMLKSCGASHVIIGHSERRQYFNEKGEVLAKKIDMAQHYGLTPIYCCGETLQERNRGASKKVVKEQLSQEIFHLSEANIQNLIIGYEPVWAIGTGENASPEQAQEMHAAIRELIKEKYNASIADNISIVYGGSVKPANAGDLFGQNDVDGGLIGGASLNPDNLMEIVKS